MHDSLLTAEWKKVIGSPAASETAPMTKKLESYAKLNGKVDADDEVVALQEINELALSLKKKLAKDAKVVGQLEKIAKGALETKKKIQADAAKEEAEAEKDGKDLILTRMLAKALKLAPDAPLYFALALGNLSGLVIAKMVSGTQKNQAVQARTRNNGKKGGGKLLTGRCYGENGKVVLDIGIKPEDTAKPPSGLAANVRKSIKQQTAGASKVKVIIRGAGVDLDEDADNAELTEFGPDEADTFEAGATEDAQAKAEYEALRSTLATEMGALRQKNAAAADKVQQVLDSAAGHANNNDFVKATNLLRQAGTALATLSVASTPLPGQGNDSLEKIKRLRTLLEQAVKAKPNTEFAANVKTIQADLAKADGKSPQEMETIYARCLRLYHSLLKLGQVSESATAKAEYEGLRSTVLTDLVRLRQSDSAAADKVQKAVDDAAGHATNNDFLKAVGLLKQASTVLAAAAKAGRMENKGPVAKPGAYQRMKNRVTEQLKSAEKKSNVVAQKIAIALKAADETAKTDEGAAVQRLRDLITEVEDLLAADRQKVIDRMTELYDKATEIRLELNPDPATVRLTVRDLVKTWDFPTANATLDAFEKAIKKAKPLDFENLDIVQKRRAEQFRKENAKHARNTEQALLTAKRLVQSVEETVNGQKVTKGKVLFEGPVERLPFVRLDDLALVAQELEASGDASLPQSVHALQMLKRLQSDATVKAAFESVTAPPDPNTAANEAQKQSLLAAQKLIRNTLGLADDAAITDVEAKRAALAALLAQVRQGDVGSCFATASAVRVQKNKPEQFLADMAALFSTGKLTRQIEYPAGTVVTVETHVTPDMVGRKVDVERRNLKADKNPRMIAGLDALGINEGQQKSAIESAAKKLRAERAVRKALGKIAAHLPQPHTIDSITKTVLDQLDASPSIEAALQGVLAGIPLDADANESSKRQAKATDACKDFDDPSGVDDFTPHELLERIAKDQPANAKATERLAAAKAAYDTSQDNTLLRAWEYTLASMVEQHPDGGVPTKKLRDGVTSALKSSLKDQGTNYGNNKGLPAHIAKIVRKRANTAIQGKFDSEFETRYDPEVSSRSGALAADGSSSKGGWCLYFRGKKIDGQEAFESACKELMEEAKAAVTGVPGTIANHIKQLIDEMKDVAETKDFRDKIMQSQTETDRFYKPWTMRLGGDTEKIMQIYENQKKPLKKESSKTHRYNNKPVSDAEGLTHFLLTQFTKMNVGGRLPDGDESERATIPVSVPTHSFTLKPGSPVIATALKQGKTPEEFIKDFKEFETKKNAKRQTAVLPTTDLSHGVVADMIEATVMQFEEANRAGRVDAIKERVRARNADTITMSDLKALLQTVAKEYLIVDMPGEDPDLIDMVAEDTAKGGMSPTIMLTGLIPEEEYAPLIETALRKLNYVGDTQDKIKKEVLEALKNKEGVAKDDLAREVRKALRKAEFGSGDKDTEKAREAYNALGDAVKRAAALKAAGKEGAAAAANFDALKDDERKALIEHGVATRLDARLDAAMMEPRGVPFADTLWGNGDHLTVFSMVVNPETNQMEMWQMNEDGSNPTVLDQKKWIGDGTTQKPWEMYADPTEYGGNVNNHVIAGGRGNGKTWETFRADLRTKLDACYVAKKGDVAQFQRLLDIADTKYAAADFDGADKLINKLADELAPVENLAAPVAKAVKGLEGVVKNLMAETDKRVKAQKEELAKGTEQAKAAAKQMDASVKQARAAVATVNGLISELRSDVQSAEKLSKFLIKRKDVIEYIDAQSPFGSPKVMEALTT